MGMDCRAWLPDQTLSGRTSHKMKNTPKKKMYFAWLRKDQNLQVHSAKGLVNRLQKEQRPQQLMTRKALQHGGGFQTVSEELMQFPLGQSPRAVCFCIRTDFTPARLQNKGQNPCRYLHRDTLRVWPQHVHEANKGKHVHVRSTAGPADATQEHLSALQ